MICKYCNTDIPSNVCTDLLCEELMEEEEE